MNRNLSRRALLAAPMLALAKSTPRNLLFLAADDLNHCFSTYGSSVVRTPNLDRIAKAGVRFDRAYCQFPLCSPSRTSLMTGLGPDATGVYDLQKHFRSSAPDVVTLAQAFQRKGHEVARVGKIYHYGNPGQIGTNGLDDEPSWKLRINPRGIDKDEESVLTNYTPKRGLGSSLSFYASPAPDDAHTDGKVAAESIRLLEQYQKQPFFLATGFYKPHCPYIAPAKYFDQVPLEKVKLVPFQSWEMEIAPKWAYFTRPANWDLTERQRLEAMRAYYATVLFLDAQVGRVLDALERLKLAGQTTIAFWSDHGYGLGEHGQWMKQTLFEYAARTPLMIAGAGVKARGKACRRTVELLDLYPTVADLFELDGASRRLHGRSLRPLLERPDADWDRPAITQVQGRSNGRTVMGYSLRTERYRYTMWDEGREGEELYDYNSRQGELKNLAAESRTRTVRQELRQKLEQRISQIKSK